MFIQEFIYFYYYKLNIKKNLIKKHVYLLQLLKLGTGIHLKQVEFSVLLHMKKIYKLLLKKQEAMEYKKKCLNFKQS